MPPIRAVIPFYLFIRDAEPIGARRLLLTLCDGTLVVRDFSRFFGGGGVFAPIERSDAVFRAVWVRHGTVGWLDEIDLCKDVVLWGGMPPREPGARPLPTMNVLPPGWKRARSRWLTPAGEPRSSPTWGQGPRPRDVLGRRRRRAVRTPARARRAS